MSSQSPPEHEVHFSIDIAPVIQQRPRKGKCGNFYDPSSKERKALSLGLIYARASKKFRMFAGPISVVFLFYYFADGHEPDLSNMVKALEDSGNGVLWKDDKQIYVTFARKIPCKRGTEHIHVTIEPLEVNLLN